MTKTFASAWSAPEDLSAAVKFHRRMVKTAPHSAANSGCSLRYAANRSPQSDSVFHTALERLPEMRLRFLGHVERLLPLPPEVFFRQRDFVRTER